MATQLEVMFAAGFSEEDILKAVEQVYRNGYYTVFRAFPHYRENTLTLKQSVAHYPTFWLVISDLVFKQLIVNRCKERVSQLEKTGKDISWIRFAVKMSNPSDVELFGDDGMMSMSEAINLRPALMLDCLELIG